MTSRTILSIVVLLVACSRELPPAGQVVIYIDTDTIVPERAGTPPDPNRLSPLVDRARIEVLLGGVVQPNSTRDFALDAEMFRQKKVSFGVVPPPGETNVTARVLLFRADRATEGTIEPGVALETIIQVPTVAEDGISEVSITMKTDDFGSKIGPMPPEKGPPKTSLVGTWRGGRRVSCAAAAKPGEACVTGGAFFFGNPQFRGRTTLADIYEERLVVVSPFYLDLTEVTVADFKKTLPALKARGVELPLPWSGVVRADSADPTDFCTFKDEPDPNRDGLALNCISWPTAHEYCRELGKDLPTEAQMEFVMSGLGEEWAFPWGNDEPDCRAAVWGRGGYGVAKDDPQNCREPGTFGGPTFPRQGQSDNLGSAILRNTGGETISDLGGNLSEWMLDAWARPTDAYWKPVRPMIDPINVTMSPDDGEAHTIRGGNWFFSALTTRAGFRRRRLAPEEQRSTGVGFRCARSGREGG